MITTYNTRRFRKRLIDIEYAQYQTTMRIRIILATAALKIFNIHSLKNIK